MNEKMWSMKSCRAEVGYTLEDMAKYLNVSRVTYFNKEHGKATLTAKELISISKLVGINPSQIEIPK